MDKIATMDFPLRWIICIVLGFVFISVLSGFLVGLSSIAPLFIIGLLALGIVTEVLWGVMK